MGRIRLDDVNHDMVLTVLISEDLEDGVFGQVKNIKSLDHQLSPSVVLSGFDRETYVFSKFEAGVTKGRIVFLAHDGHRYGDPSTSYDEQQGFDKKLKKDGRYRAYFHHMRGMITVEPKVLGDTSNATSLAQLTTLNAGDFLKPKATSYELEKTTTEAEAVAIVEGKEMWCGHPMYVIRFI